MCLTLLMLAHHHSMPAHYRAPVYLVGQVAVVLAAAAKIGHKVRTLTQDSDNSCNEQSEHMRVSIGPQ